MQRDTHRIAAAVLDRGHHSGEGRDARVFDKIGEIFHAGQTLASRSLLRMVSHSFAAVEGPREGEVVQMWGFDQEEVDCVCRMVAKDSSIHISCCLAYQQQAFRYSMAVEFGQG